MGNHSTTSNSLEASKLSETTDGASRERAAVVAWLRAEDYPCCRQCNGQLADAIERGDHRTEETP